MSAALVIADLIRNPGATWQWMPDQVRHDSRGNGSPRPDDLAMTKSVVSLAMTKVVP